jgi:hypothetical protein
VIEALENAFALGDRGKIRDHLATLDALQPGALTPFLKAHRARFRGRLAGRDHQDADLDGEFSTAEGIFRRLETPFYLAVTQLEHAESLLELGRTEEVSALLSEARAAFEGLGAKPWLERVADALGPAHSGIDSLQRAT